MNFYKEVLGSAEDGLHEVTSPTSALSESPHFKSNHFKPTNAELSRRQFIRITGLTGLALGLAPAGINAQISTIDNPRSLTHYVHIGEDGKVTIFAPNPDVGQGVKTSLPMIVAEELDADWANVTCELAAVDESRYGQQFAGGSLSTLFRWPPMREVGAMARQMLVSAAAQKLNVDPSTLSTEKGWIIHSATGNKLSYGEIASDAAKLPLPDKESLVFKKPKDYTLIGTRVTSVDNETIVAGKPIFGIDMKRPGMVHATYVQSPTLGARIKSANLKAIKKLPGVIDAFIVKGNKSITYFSFDKAEYQDGVAIVAESTWQALKARQSLDIDWDLSEAKLENTEALNSQAKELLKSKGESLTAKGDVDKALTEAAQQVSSFYQTDYLSHAQLEPENCTVEFNGDSAELWIPTQTPGGAQKIAAEIFELPVEKVTVHQVRGGGGFGRRLANDYVSQAAVIAKKIKRPVKLQWTREDDMAHDYLRPAAWYQLTAGLNDRGVLTSWDTHVVTHSEDGKNAARSAGLLSTGYPEHFVSDYREQQSLLQSYIPTGPVRAPKSNTFAFAEQSFVHELTVKAGRDHLEFLIETMGKPAWTYPGNLRKINTERAIAVIKKVAENAEWGRKMPKGHALGLSFYFSHAAHVAEIAEVSVEDNNKIHVHKVWMVADVGQVINASGIEGQAIGSIIDGMSTMNGQRVSFKDGAVEQTNFDRYPLLRSFQRPKIAMEFIRTGDFAPSGFGEPALPPIAAAICNGVYTLTGKRIRRLPISQEGFDIV